MQPKILIVDDDRAVRSALKINLSKHNKFLVETATNAMEAIRLLSESTVDLVLTDVKMPGESGMTLLRKIKDRWPDIPVVIMTGFGSVEDAVEAIKMGASDYLIKPVTKDALFVVIDKALENNRMRSELNDLRSKVEERYGFGNLIGNNEKMRQIYDLASHVAGTSATVLIQGPTGTGKELLAHAIHYNSDRKNRPFIRVNCSALPENLLESELFGHEKGAFSGAIRQHRGRFELADEGTILLDEIGEISPAMQVKLLRVLEEGEFQRIGGMETLKVDVRVIAATNRILSQEVEAGRFRQDLFYRLNVFTIEIPPLRDRRDDIPLLAEHFLRKYSAKNKKKISRIHPAVLQRLMDYDWPGNVRELEHVIEKAVIMTRSREITEVDLPKPKTPPPSHEAKTLAEALRECERNVIIEALRAENGVQARAAKALGISRSNLNYRLHKLKLKVPEIMGW